MRTLVITAVALMCASVPASAATVPAAAAPGPGVTVVHLTQRAERLMPRRRRDSASCVNTIPDNAYASAATVAKSRPPKMSS